ncbi:MAG: FUSC family protein [Candidatus Altiarchaeia archaeon]
MSEVRGNREEGQNDAERSSFRASSVFESSGDVTPPASGIFAGVLGITAPLIVGALMEQPGAGMIVSLGGLALSGSGSVGAFRERFSDLACAFAATSLAIACGVLVAADLWFSVFLIPLIAFFSGLFGGISRPLARASGQFIVFMIIAAGLNVGGGGLVITVLLFCLGAAWTAVLSLVLYPVFQNRGTGGVYQPARRHTAEQLLSRWRRTLAHFGGWFYPLRIGLCLLVAGFFQMNWPYGHGYWILITVAIVVQRSVHALLKRMLQRALGTFAGILFASIFLFCVPPLWIVILVIGVLAALRSAYKESNYAAYSAVMTLLVLLLLDYGKEAGLEVIIDRLFSTLTGCVIALVFGYLLWPRSVGEEKPLE